MLPIEANPNLKRQRSGEMHEEQIVVEDVDATAWLRQEVRDDAWYARVLREYGPILRNIRYEIQYQAITTVERLREGSLALRLDINLEESWSKVLGDLSYLSIFPAVRIVRFFYEHVFPEHSLDRPIPVTLDSGALAYAAPTLTHFFIDTMRHKIVGMSYAFRNSLGRIRFFHLRCPLHLESPKILSVDLESMPSVYVKRVESDGVCDLRSLEGLELGIHSAWRRDLDMLQSTVDDTWFLGALRLTRIEISNIKLALLNIERIAPNLQDLRISFCALTRIPAGWINSLARTLIKLNLGNTTLSVFDESQFWPFVHLEELAIGNDDDDIADGATYHPGYLNNFGPQDVTLSRMPHLVELRLENLPMQRLVLGNGGNSDTANPAFQHLSSLTVRPGANVLLRPGTNRTSGAFLPVLGTLEIDLPASWEEDSEEGYRTMDIRFPRWILGVFTLVEYNGPKWIDVETNSAFNLDLYIPPNRVFNTNEDDGELGYLAILREIVQANAPRPVPMTTTNRMLLSYFTNPQVPHDVHRIVDQMAQNFARDRQIEMLAPHVQQSIRENWNLRLSVPWSRAAPYFVRYNPTLSCVDDQTPLHPFEVDPSTGAMPECAICDNAFDREMHDADTAEIVDNSFLAHRNENAIAYERGELGCVVMCNVLASDFDRNHYVVQPSETHAHAVSSVQCVHRQHAFHRVCYSNMLYDQFDIQNPYRFPNTEPNYHCIHTRTRFYPVPGETMPILPPIP